MVDPSCEFVAVHDAARPCLTTELVDAVFDAARRHGAALPAVPVADTIKRVGADRFTTETIPRGGLVPGPDAAGLPPRPPAARLRRSGRLGAGVTDDTQLVEASGHPCAVVEGSPLNLKITTAADLRLASAILQALPKPKREGPVHPFADERAMWGESPAPKRQGPLLSRAGFSPSSIACKVGSMASAQMR